MKNKILYAFWLLVFAAIGLSSAPIRLHPKNPHYFLYRNRAVALITSGEHYGAVLNGAFDYRRYLATLEAEGLNYTRLFGGSYREMPTQSFGIRRNTLAPAPGKFIAPWAKSNTPGYALGGNKFDLARWDPQFFERYRDFLSEAAKRGIVVEITLFTSQYAEMQWKISPLNPANNVNGTDAIDWKMLNTLENGNLLAEQERYTRKLVREANPFDNVIFEIANEPWSDRPEQVDVINPYLDSKARNVYPNSIEIADALSTAWQTRVKDWITSEETNLPNKHLVAQNYCNFLFPVRSLVPGVDVVNFHYAYPEAVLLNYGLEKAISYDETGFIGRQDTTYRRQAWNFMLSGGSVFNNLDYSFTVGHEDGSDTEPNGPGGGSPAVRQQLRVLAEFLQSLPLIDMAPDTRTVKHVMGAYARVLSSPGRDYAIYFDGKGPSEITLDLPSGQYSSDWLNTGTGQIERSEHIHSKGGTVTLRTPTSVMASPYA
ncbi:MAG: hypothetical protein M3Y72_22035 [Acidobacteriota bacterium]|nr:hypothetical protein [Acidobacteriota bacterium]MDQ2843669.1 hypothetical protein [Acidobacteriota bacterium]